MIFNPCGVFFALACCLAN